MRLTLRRRHLACAAAVLALAACGGDDDRAGDAKQDAATSGATAPAREGALQLVAMPGQAERGKTDPRYDWIGPFERSTGCVVAVETVPSHGALLARLAGGEVDAAIVPGDIVLTLVGSGDVAAIETTRVPALAQVDPRLADGAWARRDGTRYAVPFVWRPQGLRYRADVFGATPPTGAELYAPRALPDGRSNTGRMQAIDSPMAIGDAAMHLAATRPELRIDDPFALDARQYAAALALLRAQSGLLHRYWSSAREQRLEFESGGIVLATGWPHPSRAATQPSFAWTAPANDVPAQVEAAVLSRRAEHPHCAYAWFEAMLDPAAQAAAAAWLGAVPANARACAEPLLGVAACRAHGADLLPRARFRRPAQADCGRKGGCVPYSRWTEDFHAVRGR